MAVNHRNHKYHWRQYHWRQVGVLTMLTAMLAACGPQQTAPQPSASTSPNTPTSTAPTGDPIKVGALLPMTGDLQAFGETTLNGINLALNEINGAGGVMGKPIAVQVGDTQTAAQPSIDAAQKLVSIESVVAIIGALSSGNTIPVAESIASKNNIPQITNASTSPVITDLSDDDYLFRTVPSDAFQGAALAQVAREQGLEKLAVIYINNDYGEGLADSFKAAFEANGGTITGLSPYEQGQASYRGELSQLADGGAEALTLIGYPENGVIILKQALEEGFFDKFVFSDGLKAPEIIDTIGAEFLNGAFGTVAQAATDSNAFKTFESAYQAAYGELPPKPYIDTAYDAMMVLALAIEQAGSTDGASIRDALRDVANGPGIEIGPGEWAKAAAAIANGEDIDYVGASGSCDLDENGDVAGSFAHWAVDNGEIVTVKVFEPKI